MCSHSKLAKDPSTAKFVPAMKKSMETLLYSVKSMMALNNAIGTFQLGVLKNRDLQGQEIADVSMTSSGEVDDLGDGSNEEEDVYESEDEADEEEDDEEAGSVCV